ncbi:uncharacterized protein LOC144945695 [Lampetra fluviatilis]
MEARVRLERQGFRACRGLLDQLAREVKGEMLDPPAGLCLRVPGSQDTAARRAMLGTVAWPGRMATEAALGRRASRDPRGWDLLGLQDHGATLGQREPWGPSETRETGETQGDAGTAGTTGHQDWRVHKVPPEITASEAAEEGLDPWGSQGLRALPASEEHRVRREWTGTAVTPATGESPADRGNREHRACLGRGDPRETR